MTMRILRIKATRPALVLPEFSVATVSDDRRIRILRNTTSTARVQVELSRPRVVAEDDLSSVLRSGDWELWDDGDREYDSAEVADLIDGRSPWPWT